MMLSVMDLSLIPCAFQILLLPNLQTRVNQTSVFPGVKERLANVSEAILCSTA